LVKANGYRGAGAPVSMSAAENRREVCRGGCDVAPCVRPFQLFFQLSPPCGLLCVVCVRPSPLRCLPHLDLHAHWWRLRKE
jgi:hypothetical protein